ncbi:MAG: hypothetical protein ACRBEQ_03210 [Hyphomonas sp.]
MLPELDHNAPFIYAIYGLGAFGVFAMTLGVVLKARSARKKFERAEALKKS